LNIGPAAFAGLWVAPPAGAAGNTDKTTARSALLCGFGNATESDEDETHTCNVYSGRLQEHLRLPHSPSSPKITTRGVDLTNDTASVSRKAAG
jgi:hypothetical protein